MSIADKLTYLNTTKQLLKTEINKINNVLDDNSTFRSYPQELFNGYLDILNNGTDTLWNNLEKVSQTGTEAVLEGVETAPIKMVLNGNTSQDGEPSPDFPQQVKVVKGENVVSVSGKNLIDQSNVLSTLTYNSETGYYEGTSTSAITTALTGIFEDNVQYTFKYLGYKENAESEGLQARFTYTDGTENHINFPLNTTAQERSITSLNGKTVASFEIRYLRQRSIHIKDLMLYRGTDINTPYVPYSKTDYPISLGTIEMCKIGNYQDFFFEAKNGDEYYDTLTAEQKNALNYGSWYVHKAIKKVVFNGTENWNLQSINDYGIANFQRTAYIDDYVLGTPNLSFNNYFSPQISLIAVTQTVGYFLNTSKVLYVRFESSVASTPTEFKNWLSTHNMILYYVLATPTEEEITNTTLIEQLEAISKAKSVKDKTYITQTNDDLPFILDVEAIKEYEVV